MEDIVIKFDTNPEALIPIVTLLEKIGQVDKATADQFRKDTAAYQDRAKATTELSQTTETAAKSMDDLSKASKDVQKNLATGAAGEAFKKIGDEVEKTEVKTKRLTTQLRDLKNQLSVLESQGKQNTKQFFDTAIAAGKLEDQIGDTAKRIRALGSDTKNIDAVVGAVSGLASAFSVAQGAAALFGGENQDLQKALLKVQAAMAIANGVQQISNLLQKESAVVLAYQRGQLALTAITTGLYTTGAKIAAIATAAWNRILLLNPIVAIATAITLAVTAIYQFVKGTDDSAEATEKLNKKLQEEKKFVEEAAEAWKKHNEAINESIDIGNENIIDNIETQIKLAKIRGASLTEIFELEKKLIDARLTLLKNSGNADTAQYNSLLNDKKVLTATYYKNLAEESRKSNADLKKLEEDTTAVQKRETEVRIAILQMEMDAQENALRGRKDNLSEFLKKIIETETNRLQEADDEKLKEIVRYNQAAAALGTELFNFGQVLINNEINALEDKFSRGLIGEKAYQRELARLRRKEAVAKKDQAMFQAIINTALAVITAFADGGLPLSILAGITGAAQIAAIAAQPIPAFAKGTELVKGGKAGKDSVGALLMPGERIVPTDINAQLMGIPNSKLPELVRLKTILDEVPLPITGVPGSAYSDSGIDIDLLASKIGKEFDKSLDKRPVEENHFNERGYRKAVRRGNAREEYLNDRYFS